MERVDVEELESTSTSSVYPSLRKPGTSFWIIFNLNWDIKSVTRFDEMKQWTKGVCAAPASYGKEEGEVKSLVDISRDVVLSFCNLH